MAAVTGLPGPAHSPNGLIDVVVGSDRLHRRGHDLSNRQVGLITKFRPSRDVTLGNDAERLTRLVGDNHRAGLSLFQGLYRRTTTRLNANDRHAGCPDRTGAPLKYCHKRLQNGPRSYGENGRAIIPH